MLESFFILISGPLLMKKFLLYVLTFMLNNSGTVR